MCVVCVCVPVCLLSLPCVVLMHVSSGFAEGESPMAVRERETCSACV